MNVEVEELSWNSQSGICVLLGVISELDKLLEYRAGIVMQNSFMS